MPLLLVRLTFSLQFVIIEAREIFLKMCH